MKIHRSKFHTIALSLIEGIGPLKYALLVDCLKGIDGVFSASRSDLSAVKSLNKVQIESILSKSTFDKAEDELRLCETLGVETVACFEKSYPKRLLNIQGYPPIIYLKGNRKLLESVSIAVVGTRRATHYGKSAAAKFANDLSLRAISTVSGLARGIDSAVHQASIDAGGSTVAVLGNGINRIYPPENKKLQNMIAESGLLVSEFPLNLGPDKFHFPRRNRIISGLSLGTVVIECEIKSGALITAKFALEQGKEVFAVPGQIFSRYSAGPHYLLKSGAHVAETADDVINAIDEAKKFSKQKGIPKNKAVKNKIQLDLEENKIFDIINSFAEGASIDCLSTKLDMPVEIVSGYLLSLEMKDIIEGLPGKVYITKQ